jgi:hypothetical protein
LKRRDLASSRHRTESFTDDEAVLSKDNLTIAFAVHTVWRVEEGRVPLFMERYNTTVFNRYTIDVTTAPASMMR